MSGAHYDELAVTYGTMDALATELGNQAKKLEEDLEALKQAVLNVSSGWGGEAYSEFQKKSAQWDKHARGIHAALVQISQRVQTAGGDYRGGDLKGASYFM
ncbi:WXG100 family type VII secretion target [Streptomyces spinoverrucosus]|uniref:WXG100 family type VII secretion target n=1 Tax=Streptomyces spinoverrucosus TaxID=284043 RepID=UPI0018C44170|nr:WXG100 family type VII secretion target [Streptomyces spinoverrucosus]MBG0852103.1 WXG100 family type VII secretion target [Streptomyces spinoverrucosus]